MADRGDGYAQLGGRLFQTQPAEITQLDDPDLALVELRQRNQRVVKRDEFGGLLIGKRQRFVERKFLPAAAAFVRRARARVLDQYLAHQLRGHSVKMPPALPFGKILLDQPQVSLIDKRGRLQCVIRALPAQIAVSQLAKLLVYDRHQLVERSLFASAPA